jgi:hypothetical protein
MTHFFPNNNLWYYAILHRILAVINFPVLFLIIPDNYLINSSLLQSTQLN